MTKDLQAFSCLVIADESEEFPDALIYAGLLCRYTGWRLRMLRVIEPSDPAPVGVDYRGNAPSGA